MDQYTYDSMIRKRDNVDHSWEKRISKYTIDDVNEDAFEEYLRKAKEAGRIAFEAYPDTCRAGRLSTFKNRDQTMAAKIFEKDGHQAIQDEILSGKKSP